jgi:hypothetical protein
MAEKKNDEGQVSEVSGMTDDAVSDGDAVAGQPTTESGTTDEGPTGPDAPSDHRDRTDEYPDKGDIETTG